MNRLLTRYFLLSFSVFLIGLVACDKDKTTVINGRVVDKHTGIPIASAQVFFTVYHKGNLPPNDYEYPSVYTDGNGEFNFNSNKPIQIFEVDKVGYLQKGQSSDLQEIIQEEINEVVVQLIPIDGLLRLSIENITGQFDSIFIGIYSPFLDTETDFSNGNVSFEKPSIPFSIGTTYIKDIPIASRETIQIYWTNHKPPLSISLFPYKDSIFIKSNEVTLFNISF